MLLSECVVRFYLVKSEHYAVLGKFHIQLQVSVTLSDVFRHVVLLEILTYIARRLVQTYRYPISDGTVLYNCKLNKNSTNTY